MSMTARIIWDCRHAARTRLLAIFAVSKRNFWHTGQNDSMTTDSSPDAHNRDRDALTDALSRQRFLDLLGDEKRLADTTGRAFALCLFDIDALRNINESFGHGAGDAAVIELAARVRAVLDSRPWCDVVDLHARFDGGALIVFLRGTSIDHGTRFADSVRAAAARALVEARVTMTVSAGVAGYRAGEPVDAVLTRAEQSLHLAKQFGRDRVETAPNPPPESLGDNLIPFPGTGLRERSKAS